MTIIPPPRNKTVPEVKPLWEKKTWKKYENDKAENSYFWQNLSQIFRIIHEDNSFLHAWPVLCFQNIKILWNTASFSCIYINSLLVCLSVCLFVCLYPINVKTDEPIGSQETFMEDLNVKHLPPSKFDFHKILKIHKKIFQNQNLLLLFFIHLIHISIYII